MTKKSNKSELSESELNDIAEHIEITESNEVSETTEEINHEQIFSDRLSKVKKDEHFFEILDEAIEHEYTNKGRPIPKVLQVLIAMAKK